MKEFSIKDLTQVIKANPEWNTSHERRATSHVNFAGVSTDSRTTKGGDCFFAIVGEKFDGHDFVMDAFARGAVCAVVSKDVSSCVWRKPFLLGMRDTYGEKKKLDSCLRRNDNTQYAVRNTQYEILKVDDTVKALGDFAREYRRQAGFKVVAITGSVGKTMTRHITYHVLSRHFRVFQSPKNYNNQIGLPLTLLGAGPEDEIVIAELGSNHPGEIAYLSGIAQPDIAVVTNARPAHLEGFGSLQTVIKEKLSISEGLNRDGVLIINAELLPDCLIDRSQVLTFGKSDSCDVKVQKITYTATGSSFNINGKQINLPASGPGNVDNAIAAWAVCSRFGLSIDDFARAVETLTNVPMRAELLRIGTVTVINDCYNANPASMKNALEILANLGLVEGRRLVFVCGDMAELGQYAHAMHTELGISIAQAKVQVLLTVGEFADVTAEAAKKAADYHLQAECFRDILSLCKILREFIRPYDIILVKGSRTAKLEIITERLKELFS